MRGSNLWKELGLEPTQDKSVVKKAYAQKLKSLDLAKDREAFQRLRGAFEWALAYCERQSPPQEAPVDLEVEEEVEEAEEGEETPESPEPPKPARKMRSTATRPMTVESSPLPDPREAVLQAADRITEALEKGQEREAAYELEQTSAMEDFQSLEARWLLAEALLNRLRPFRGRMPVAFCLGFIKHFGLKAESKKDFPRMRDMVELLLLVAELRQTLDGVKKRKIPWPWLDALQRIQLPYRPYLTWFYGFTSKPGLLSFTMEGIVEQLERVSTDTAVFGIDPRMLSWWKGRLERWFHPFRPKSIAQSYWLWILGAGVLYFLNTQRLTNFFHLGDGFLILAFVAFVFGVPLSMLYEFTIFWSIKTRKLGIRNSKIVSWSVVGFIVLLIALNVATDRKGGSGTWTLVAVLVFRFLMSRARKK